LCGVVHFLGYLGLKDLQDEEPIPGIQLYFVNVIVAHPSPHLNPLLKERTFNI